MPTITIYLTNDLYDKVRDAPSKIVREALEYYFKDRSDLLHSNSDQLQSAQQKCEDKDRPPGEQ